MTARTAILVDAIGDRFLQEQALRDRGISALHVLTRCFRDRHPEASQRAARVWPAEELDRWLEDMRRLRPCAALAGSESGVRVADRLANLLRLPAANDYQLSAERRDKHLMATALERASVPVARQFLATDVSSGCEWVERVHGTWPVIVKPLDSSGGDNVFLCRTVGELSAAIDAVLTTRKVVYDESPVSSSVLVQEYLDGPEYIVDTVSHDGRHHLLFIGAYTLESRGMRPVLKDRVDLMPYEGDTQRVLESYTTRVLDALGIRFGVAHAEVRLTADGARLVDLGARIGGVTPMLSRLATDFDPFAAAVDAVLDGDMLKRRETRGYRLDGHATNVFIRARRSGDFTLRNLPALEALPSFRGVVWNAAAGQPVVETVDLHTILGRVLLHAETRDQLETDYRAIRTLESESAFVD